MDISIPALTLQLIAMPAMNALAETTNNGTDISLVDKVSDFVSKNYKTNDGIGIIISLVILLMFFFYLVFKCGKKRKIQKNRRRSRGRGYVRDYERGYDRGPGPGYGHSRGRSEDRQGHARDRELISPSRYKLYLFVA